MNKIQVALYKDRKKPFYKDLIGWAIMGWQRLKGRRYWRYSHVELVVDGVWHTSSPRDGGVVSREIKYNPDNWHMIDIDVHPTTYNDVVIWFKIHKGKKYDTLGIFFTQFIPLGLQNQRKFYCSEACASALHLSQRNLDVAQFAEIITKKYVHV